MNDTKGPLQPGEYRLRGFFALCGGGYMLEVMAAWFDPRYSTGRAVGGTVHLAADITDTGNLADYLYQQ
jgi:hypothetical protein